MSAQAQAAQQQQAGAAAAPKLRSPVAVMQLASATTCVVLHTAAMGYRLPAEVKEFLTDPAITLVGSGVGSSEGMLALLEWGGVCQ